MDKVFSNPFNPSDHVRIRGNFTDYEDIPISESFHLLPGLNKYVYVVNGITVCLENSTWFIDSKGKKYNYILVNYVKKHAPPNFSPKFDLDILYAQPYECKYDTFWLKNSHKLGDINWYVTYKDSLYSDIVFYNRYNDYLINKIIQGHYVVPVQYLDLSLDNVSDMKRRQFYNKILTYGDPIALYNSSPLCYKYAVKKFINYHLLQAKHGNRHSMYLLGYLFHSKYNVLLPTVKQFGRDYLSLTDDDALTFIKKSANLGYYIASMCLFKYYDNCKEKQYWYNIFIKQFKKKYKDCDTSIKFSHTFNCCWYAKLINNKYIIHYNTIASLLGCIGSIILKNDELMFMSMMWGYISSLNALNLYL